MCNNVVENAVAAVCVCVCVCVCACGVSACMRYVCIYVCVHAYIYMHASMYAYASMWHLCTQFLVFIAYACVICSSTRVYDLMDLLLEQIADKDAQACLKGMLVFYLML